MQTHTLFGSHPGGQARAERILRKRSCGSLILLCGKAGAGKSTVAEFLTHECRGVLISSDRLRKRLTGLPSEARGVAAAKTGLDFPRKTTAIYEAMLERAAPVVASGRLAILDASFSTAARRDRVLRWARERGAAVSLIEVEGEESTAPDRPEKRQAAGRNAREK